MHGSTVLKMRQFTTRRLLANATGFALFLALATEFPNAARAMTLGLLLYSLVLLICAFAIWRSSKRARTVLLLLSFVSAAWVISPRPLISWVGTPTFWDLFMVDFTTVGLFTGGGALLAACIDVLL